MTNHPEEGRLQGYLDGEVLGEEREALFRHLESCRECRRTLEELGRLEGEAGHALADLEVPAARAEEALWEVRRRRAAGRTGSHRRSLAAAAVVILLVGAGAAAAMPGSPVRAWLEARLAPTPETAEAGEDRAGVGVVLTDGSLTVSFHDVPPGTWLQVELVGGERAGVFAPSASRFESGPGRVRVDFSGQGDLLRVDLPEAARSAEIVVNGELLLRKTGGVFFYPGPPPADTLEGRIRLRVPGPAPVG